MSRYIDEDALIADLDKGLWGKDYDKALTEAIIQDAPSIEIVRCKKCKYSGVRNDADVECKRHKLIMRLNDFCSYGKPKEKLKGSKRLVTGSEKPNNSKERSR